ncbi:MAG: anion permease [Chloroflexales bacterium]|nr:anion permease [Chloroflexales bacterium]
MQRPTLFGSTFVLAAVPHLRLRTKDLLALALAVLSLGVLAYLPGDLSLSIRITLGVFVLAMLGWTFSSFNTTLVALFAASGLLLSATISTENFFVSLSKSSVWLLFSACIVASALHQTGLINRLIIDVVRAARSVQMICFTLTTVLLLAALVIPSSTVRAALILPIYHALTTTLRDSKLTRVLAMLLPINIMLTAMASLVGASAHLVISDALGQLTGQFLSFRAWMLLGVPFAILAAFGSTTLILYLFLTPEERRRPLDQGNFATLPQLGPLSRSEWTVLGVLGLMGALGATAGWHGLSAALVLLLGALLLLMPCLGVLSLHDAVKNMAWELILFVATTLALVNALVETGTGQWLASLLPLGNTPLPFTTHLALLGGVTAAALAAHLAIPSRTARAAMLAPLAILLAYGLGLDPVLLALVTAAGIGYQLTLTGDDNPLVLFQQPSSGDAALFGAADLSRLNTLLAPLQFGLILVFGALYWPFFSSSATVSAGPTAQPIAPLKTGQLGLLTEGRFGAEPPKMTTEFHHVGQVSVDTTACAYLAPAATYALTISASNGTIVTDPARERYPAGQGVYLTATPQADYRLNGWIVNGVEYGATNPLLLRIDQETQVEVRFAPVIPPEPPMVPSDPSQS